MAREVVLDSTAVLAVLFNEMGSDVLMPLLEGALVSAVNLAEAHAVLVRRGVDADVAWRQLEALGCELSPMDAEQVRIAGGLVRSTRPHSLSLGDRACLALAIQRKATAYTTNAAWKNLAPSIQIEVLR